MSEKEKNQAETTNTAEEMEVSEHILELRKRIIWTILFFIAFFVTGLIFVQYIYDFFTRNLEFELVVLSPWEIMWIHIMIASVIAIGATLPFFCFQAWLFVRPGLMPKERKVTLIYVPAVFLLFTGGLLFGYFVVQELIFNFLMSLGEDMFDNMFTAEKYFRFILTTTLPFAFFFEVPLIAMFLTSLGIIDPSKMKKIRKYAYLVLVILGTMLSPPDFILQLFVAAPLIILYEIAIIMSGVVYRRKIAKDEESAVE
ncbi:sec-independent protein translocase protein TatC [Salinibacillus kushneri]|uniref:Sec-independent protein translocase protein TatC n=1 Tax=Salinibacillus kushneri TaxID=237682 RepID=A0A1I0DJA5_9BACI|nr:twin-arginine translocase subunit TatC [Salinibacillus kushneri]SET32153.1 sec-independent protein translocase protein TatC [Salinibacillus kushneri]